MFFSLCTPSVAQVGETVRSDEISLGKPILFPPYFLAGEVDGRPQGFIIDAFDAIARRTGLSTKYVSVGSGNDYIAGLEQGRFDAVFWGVTESRLERLAFTAPLQTFRISLFVRRDNRNIQSLADLANRQVGVVRANAAHNILMKRGDMKLTVFPDITTALFSLLSGQVDSIAYPEPIVLKLARDARVDDRIKVVGEPLRVVKLAFAVRKDNSALHARLNRAVRDYVASPDYRQLYTAWFGKPEPYWSVPRLAWIMGAILIALFVIMAWWRYRSILQLNRNLKITSDSREQAMSALRESQAELIDVNASLRASDERYALALAGTNDGIWERNFVTGDTYQSPRCLQMLDYPPGDFDARDWDIKNIIHPDDLARRHTAYLAHLENGSPYDLEIRLRRKSGDYIWVNARGQAAWDENGKPVRMAGSINDITARKQAEDALRTSEEQLRHAQKLEAVGQLTGGLAHDFNNLLAVIMSNAQLLERALQSGDHLHELVSPIVTASRRGAELTGRLLAFSREQTLTPISTDIGSLCKEMVDLLRRSLGETIAIEIKTAEDRWPAFVDRSQLENAMLNLAINASHAMPDGGKLTISVENASVTSQQWARRWEGEPGDYAVLSVADTGVGIPEHAIDRVFEPFFTTKDVGQGSGLGLSMVYGFARQSGGFVVIGSEKDRGTTVSLYLPKAHGAPVHQDGIATNAELPKSRGETVLLVEDEAAVSDVTSALLEHLGYTVLIAEEGTKALDVASGTERIDLLLSDMVLPGGMNGVDIYHAIGEIRPGIKCLFVSGYAAVPDLLLPEGTKILTKPVEVAILAAAVRQILDA